MAANIIVGSGSASLQCGFHYLHGKRLLWLVTFIVGPHIKYESPILRTDELTV
jgi:hypothetical protein